MSFPRYKRYKDSGVEWLGEVPEHWEVLPLYAFAKERGKSNQGMLEDNLLSLSYGRIVCKDIESNDGLLPASFETYQVVEPGDIVFRLTDLQNDKRSLRTAIVEERGIITSAYLALVIEHSDSRFINFLFRDYDNRKIFYSMGGGLRQSMKFSDLKRMPVLVPCHNEQQTITAFLDRETAKIDELIAAQKRLVELLKEKRQAVISHAVTKGLNPAAPMKDSGVEWLGAVPEHWEVLSVRRIAISVQTGRTPSSDIPGAEMELLDGIIWYTPGDFSDALRLCDSARKISRNSAASGEANLFPPRSVLVVSIGATLGKVGYIEHSASANQQINAIIPSNLVDGYFLAYSLSVKVEIMRFLSNASTIGIMNQEKTKEILLAVPSVTEQRTITTFLDRETAKIDDLTTEAQRGITLLQERRTALISAAVTGKIDVRGLTPTQLTQEVAA
jgi:type I restriction enzyme S subunit